jgi:hypothetical protein
MVTVDTVEGLIDGGRITWHYDVFADVMYVALAADMGTPDLGELNDAGDTIDRRDAATGRLIGRTGLGGQRRAGPPDATDSLAALSRWAEAIANGL